MAQVRAKTKEPTPQEMLDFLVKIACYPYKFWMSGDGGSREPDLRWLLTYQPTNGNEGYDGCVYSRTKHGVIAKAMRLFAAQELAAKIVRDAVA